MFKSKEKSHRLGTRQGMVEGRGGEWAELLPLLRAYLYCQINSYGNCYAAFKANLKSSHLLKKQHSRLQGRQEPVLSNSLGCVGLPELRMSQHPN